MSKVPKNIAYTYAIEEDFNWLLEQEKHLDSRLLKKKILDNQMLVAKSEGVILGWLRFGFFWDVIPFMNLLFISPQNRRKGIGKRLVELWELEMQKQKYDMVMTSTQSDETAQHFYRKLGYKDTGSLLLPEEPLEIIFRKQLVNNSN